MRSGTLDAPQHATLRGNAEPVDVVDSNAPGVVATVQRLSADELGIKPEVADLDGRGLAENRKCRNAEYGEIVLIGGDDGFAVFVVDHGARLSLASMARLLAVERGIG